MTVLGGLGLLAVPVLIIIGLISFLRKTGTAKKWFKISGGVFASAVLILIFFNESSSDPVEEASIEVKAEDVEEEASEVEEPTISNSEIADSFEEDIKLITEERLTLSKESHEFILENHSLFPAKTETDIEKVKNTVDSSITAKHLNKNAQPYFQKLATFQGTVISVEEFPAEVSETISVTHVMDNEGQSYQIFMYKGTGDILEEDTVRFWGAPMGLSSFENVSGGFTNVQFFLGSHIEKVVE